MSDMFKERIRFPIPLTELQRRHDAVKAMMETQGLDMLLMSNDNQFLGGYVRYFTDIPAGNAYPMTVLFEKNGEITSISMGPVNAPNPDPPDWAARVIHNRISLPYFRTLNYTNNYDADVIIDIIKKKNIKKLGLIGMGMLGYAMISMIKENTSVELINATPMLDKIKMVKSPAELEMIQLSVKMHDESVDFVKSILRPGMYEYELRAELAKWLKIYGSEEQLLILRSSSEKVTPITTQFYQNRQIQKGDYVNVLNESSGPGGFYCEIARTYVLGEPSESAVKAYETSVELQKFVADMVKPGVPANTILSRYNERLKDMGIPPETRLFMHSQGYDLVEMPGFGEKDDTILCEGIFFALHPAIMMPDGQHAFTCEDFLIDAEGAKMQMKRKQEIVIVE